MPGCGQRMGGAKERGRHCGYHGPNQSPEYQVPFYPQFYDPAYTPPQYYPAPGYTTPGQQVPGQAYQPGFPYWQPGHSSTPMYYMPLYNQEVEWLPTTPGDAMCLSNRALVAGYEGYDGSPLWVIRARFEGDLLPGKLAVHHHAAYVPWGGKENAVHNIEVCCVRPEKVRWVESQDGDIPRNAVVGGYSAGEPLYIGRAKEHGSLTPGKIQPSHRVLYMSFGGKEISHRVYDVLYFV